MSDIVVLALPWVLLTLGSGFALIFIILLCTCWDRRKKRVLNQVYMLNENKMDESNNKISHVITNRNPTYPVQGVKYSTLCSDEFSFYPQTENTDPRGSISHGVINLFKNIQRNKFPSNDSEKQGILCNLDDSNIDDINKNFDKSVLKLKWNDKTNSSENILKADSPQDNEDANSCISHSTFYSVYPHYNRTLSLGETFVSINSDS